MNRLYCDKMDCVRLSTSGKQSVIEGLAAAGEKAVPRPRRVLRTGLVAAAVDGVLLVAARAIALTAPVLREYLGGGQVYEENVQRLDLSQTVNGYTITLTDCASGVVSM